MNARIGFDATPLLGQRTGIGRYVAALAEHFASTTEMSFVATSFSKARSSALRSVVPAGIDLASRPVPARVLQALWTAAEFPPVQALAGKVDLFHGTNFVLPPLRRAAGVLTVHDLAYLRFPATVSAASSRYRELVPRGIQRASVVCTLTAALADDVAAEYSYPRERIVITAPGVDASWFDAAPLDSAQLSRLGLDANYLVAVGTVEPRKNLALLVQAHRRLGADAPMLAIAGPAGWGPQLGVTAADRVVLTGYLAPDVLRSVVAGARLLAFPSLYEGFGLPPLEALACGVPVVVTDLPATREVLGACATYFPSGDADALQAALADVLATPGDGFARRTYARDWTWNRCAESVLHAYRLALQG